MTFAAALLRAASLLAPPPRRKQWLDDWRAELWDIAPEDAAAFSLGAFRDALWLRRHDSRPLLDTPLRCLTCFAAVAALSTALTLLVPARHSLTPSGRFGLLDLAGGWFAMLVLSALLLPATRLAMGPPPAGSRSFSWRRAAFFAAKLALAQPILLAGFVAMLWILPVVPIAPQLAVCGSWFLTFRWLLLDQRRRCPDCLHLLTDPVRIGTPSRTFLEWYGAEATCSRGHGLLHISENPAGSSRWLRLDESWKELFS